MIELHRARPQPDLQPRLLHVGRAAGHAVRAVRGAPQRRTFWRGLRRYLAGVGRDDHRVQRPRRAGAVTVVARSARAGRAPCAARTSTSPTPLPLALSRTRPTRDRHHVLQLVQRGSRRCAPPTTRTRSSPTGRAWRGTASPRPRHDADAARRAGRQLDAAIAAVAGTGFRVTPFDRADALVRRARLRDRRRRVGEGRDRQRRRQPQGPPPRSRSCCTCCAAEALGLAPWRRSDRPPLAIASCGNAAIAAATLAARRRLAARRVRPAERATRRCSALLRAAAAPTIVAVPAPRSATRPAIRACTGSARPSPTGRCRSRVQGTENVLVPRRRAHDRLGDGRAVRRRHRSIGCSSRSAAGALAACVGAGSRTPVRAARLHAVQTDGCAPLDRAWRAARAGGGRRAAAAHWSELHVAVGARPRSAADGILDDETYDWLGVVRAMRDSGGRRSW